MDIRGLIKDYGGFRALRGASFNLQAGEVHALMGQNGAGKSTLIKVLAGVESATGGEVRIFGELKSFRSSADASRAGIAVVYQDLSLIPGMSVADNLLLGREPTGPGGLIRRSAVLTQAKEVLDSYGFKIDPRAKVEDLPFAYKQLTEIAKALMSDARILILDEPTSALTEDEEEVLFGAVRQVVERGVAVVYVTHRLNEVFKLCNRVTIIRDGVTDGTYNTNELDMRGLAAAIVGSNAVPDLLTEPVVSSQPRPASAVLGEPAIELSNVSADSFSDINLRVDRGEVVGLAGPLGSGRTEILELMFGLRKVTSGQMRLYGAPVRFRSPMEAIANGVGLVPEDRHAEGLVLSHSIDRNVAMPALPRLSRCGAFLRRRSFSRSAAAIRELSIKAESVNTVLSSLSGGNQQKVVFAKWGDPRCKLLLLDEPTVGVDIGAREEIYREIRSAAALGSGVVVVSSDLSELLLLCDRIYMVNNQTIQGEAVRSEIRGEEDLHHRIHQSIDTPQRKSS
ncbi:sugar ABC transporter [Thioclava sp. SK-1]|nr:sugar ABC transporter [Thioclava sp. SK-1]